MENKIYEVLVNFNGAGSISSDAIVITKGDYNSVTLKFLMSKKDYLLAMFYLVKPDGKYYANSIENDEITFDDINIFDKEGYYHFGVALYDEDSKLTNSAKGLIKVVDNETKEISDEVINDNKYPILDNLINRVLRLQSSVEETVSDIEKYNKNAEDKLSEFNNNYEKKIDNFNSNILAIQEETEGATGVEFNKYADSKRIEEGIKNYFALTPDDGVYTVKFPLWNTSQSSLGEKLDKNKDKFLNLATDTNYEESNYGVAFDTYDCNAEVDENGVRHITAVKGMNTFKDTGKVDVFVFGRTYYEKFYEKDGYFYYSRSYLPKEGFKVCPLSINKDGSISPYWLIAKYVAGDIPSDNGDHILYSSKGLIPTHYLGKIEGDEEFSDNICYNQCITLFKKKGLYYSAGISLEYKHLITTFWLKFATKNSQSILAGNTINSYQYKVSKSEENVNRVVLTKTQANNIDIDSYVSVGDPTAENTNHDRSYGYMHNLAYDVRVIGKEDVDEENIALILEHDNFNTTETTYVSTMHERSGYSDRVLGRNGSIGSNTNGKHGAVLDGIEFLVGGYEVYGNVVVDINAESLDREIYVTNDAKKLSTAINTIKSTYNKSKYVIKPTEGAWKYITDVKIDEDNNIIVPVGAGESGSGSNTGFADAVVTDNATSGQREFLGFGYLTPGAGAGLSCVYVGHALSIGRWYFLARPSINLVGGEMV